MSSNLEPRAVAKAGKTFVVNTLNDEKDGVSKGKVSLRDAIAEANKTPVQDTIKFAKELLGGKIKLTQGDLDITNPLIIQGIDNPKSITIESAGNIFNVDDNKANTNIKVKINNLKIQGVNVNKSSENVGINNLESLEVNQVTISRLGKGIQNEGNARVNRSIFDNNVLGFINGNKATNATITKSPIYNSFSAGILNRAKMTLDQSSITKNIGAGIVNFGMSYDGYKPPQTTMIINNSTIAGNGDIYLNETESNGLAVVEAKIFIFNSTISGNTGVGGGLSIITKSQATLINSTITKNTGTSVFGGGVMVLSSSTLTIGNTIIAGNSNKPYPNGLTDNILYDYKESIKSLGSNLIGAGDYLGAFKQKGDIVGADPRLQSLANNGGATQTHALRSNSPAVDRGNNNLLLSTFTTDQRGQPRRRNARIDIGAFELQTKPTKNLDSLTGLESDAPLVGIATPQTRETNFLTPLPREKISSFEPSNLDYQNIAYQSLSDSIREIILNSTSDKHSDLNVTRNPLIERDYFPQITASDLW